jgi:SAM-dependent methyltransferase
MSGLGGRIWRRLLGRTGGGLPGYFRHRLSEWMGDARLGIRTQGTVPLAALGISNPACKPYAPTAYRSFREAMRHVPVTPQDVFLDYGAGKGRAVILAATYSFARVIGVEISPELSARARANVEAARRRLHCREIEIVTSDAAAYRLPDEVTVIHFFDPFKDAILRAVLDEIRSSLERRPREATILFADPHHLEELDEPWIRKVAAVPYPFADARERSLRFEYGIYRVRPPSGLRPPSLSGRG